MKKKFLENLAFFLTLNLVIKPIYVFGIDRAVQNSVGAEIYGSYFPLLNLVLIFQVILDLGIENYTRREIGTRPERMAKIFPSLFFLKILLSFVFVGTFTLIGFYLLKTSFEWKLFVVLLVNQSMASFILYLRANMGGLQLFKSESVISVIDRLIMIFLCGGLLLHPFTTSNFRMEWFVLAQTASYATTLLISIIMVVKRSEMKITFISFSNFLPIFKRLWPFTLLTLLMAFYFRVDSILLRFMLEDGAEQAGIYAHGFRILDFMSNYALIFALILLPTFSKMIRRNESVNSLLKLAALALIVPSVALLTGIYFYRYDVFSLLYKQHIAVSSEVFGIMIISFIGVCISYTYGALLTAKGCLRELNTMAIFAVVLSITLNLIFIPKYKVVGAAISNAMVQIFTILFHVLVVYRKFKFRFSLQLAGKLAGFLLVALLLGYSISSTSIHWIFGVCIIFGTLMLIALFIRLLRISYVKDLFHAEPAKE